MKKLLIAASCFALLVSCDKDPQNGQKEKPQEEPVEISITGSQWRTNHHQFTLTAERAPDDIKEEIEQEVSVDVSEYEAYVLTFDEDGDGTGSGALSDEAGRYNFDFTWEVSDGILWLTETGDGYEGVFPTHYGNPYLGWTIEEYTDDEMILTIIYYADVDGVQGGWRETHTYRYTFERVE